MTPEREHLLMIIAMQEALQDDGHDDPYLAFAWAVQQGLLRIEIDPGRHPQTIPKSVQDIIITPRGREYIHAWSERRMEAALEELLGD